MKTLLTLGFVLCLTALDGSPGPAVPDSVSRKESAVVEFSKPIKLMSVVLQGQYLFVHDEQRMRDGEDCTYVYEMGAGRPVRLVVSFHCVPVPRQRVETFAIRSSLVSTQPVLYELWEYQFAGSTEGHQVPSSTEARSATVDLFACCL
jgi:hypothetical protein